MTSININLMDSSRLSKLIGTIGRQRVRIDNLIQTAAVQCVAQSIVHRNSTPAAQLYDALGKSNRRDSLLTYFERFGNLTWSKVESRVIFFDVGTLPSKQALEWTETYATKVNGTLWFNAKPEPKAKSAYDVEDAVSKLIETVERAVKKGTEVKGLELFDAVSAAYYGFRADLADERANKQRTRMEEDGKTDKQIADATHATAAREGELPQEGRSNAPGSETVLTEAAKANAPTPEQLATLQEHFGHADVKAAA